MKSRIGVVLSVILCTALVLTLSPTPLIADSSNRTPDYGPPGGSATAYELAAAMDIPAELIVGASLGSSDPAGAHVFAGDGTLEGFDEPSIIWDPAHENNFSVGRGHSIDSIVIHYCAGSASSARAWFKNGSSGVSAHYIIDNDGNIYQMVSDEDTAYHATYYNSRSIGIELEGDGSSFSSDMYRSLANLINHLKKNHPNIPLRHPTETAMMNETTGDITCLNVAGVVGHEQIQPFESNRYQCVYGTQIHAKQDPGPNFEWDRLFFAAISSGNAENAPLPNNSGSLSTVLSGLNNNQGNDMVQLTLELEVPSGAEYWAVDWKFFSEEYPEWVGSVFNDAFLIETPSSTFTISGSDIVAPNNVATDPSGELVTVNTVGAVGMSTANSVGTTYDGATEMFTTLAPIPPEADTVTIVFSVMDLGDSVYDTTVFLDSFRFSEVGSPLLGLAEDTSSDLKEWADFMVELHDNKAETIISAGVFVGTAAVCAAYLIPPATPFGAICLTWLGIGWALEEGIYWTAYIIAYYDPPDDNFYEVVPIEPVVPWEPYCDDCPLALAQAEYGTALAEQQAILAAILTTLERLQGAAIADEPAFFIMQAEALRDYMELARVKQDQVSSLLTQLGEQVVAAIAPIQEEIIEISLRISSEGFSAQEREELLAGGLSETEIQMIEELFQSTELTEELISDIQPAIALWNQEMENIVTPALDQAIENIDNMLFMLENPESNHAPAFDFPPTPPAGSEYLVGTGATFNLSVQASDQDLNDQVSLILFEPPTGAALSVLMSGQVSTGNLTWIPTTDQVGVHILTIIASDKYGLAATPYQITVVAQMDNQSPVADAGSDQTAERTSAAGAEVTLDGSGSYDPDGDPLTYSWNWAGGGSASGVSPTVTMPMGTTTVTLEVSDAALSDTDTVDITVEDTTPPAVIVEFPTEGLAAQDGIILKASASDLSDVAGVYFYVREPDCPEGQVISPEFEDLLATHNSGTGKWEYTFDTLALPDGNYIALAKGVDTYGNEGWSDCVPFSIRNWAVIELLPASQSNKARRTMPVKFALRVSASVDPSQPFVWNDELTIKIFATSNPSSILQASTFGDTSRDYRIDSLGELYITNFKTSRVPTQYTVEIWRTSKDFMVGSFTFETVR